MCLNKHPFFSNNEMDSYVFVQSRLLLKKYGLRVGIKPAFLLSWEKPFKPIMLNDSAMRELKEKQSSIRF